MDAQQEIAELKAALVAKDAEIAALMAQVAALIKQVAHLTEKLGKNSGNSNKPPSSDPPSTRAERREKDRKSKRGRGGQPGHPGSKRELLPPARVDAVVDVFPPECENCWAALPKTLDSAPQRYQTTELPPVTPHTAEYREHAVVCPCCAYRTRAQCDQSQLSPFGPRLSSVVALLTGVYHLSRPAAVRLLADVVGVNISLGAVSAIEARVADAVKPAVDEAWSKVEQAKVKHTAGTSWFQAGIMRSLWTIATTMATERQRPATAQRPAGPFSVATRSFASRGAIRRPVVSRGVRCGRRSPRETSGCASRQSSASANLRTPSQGAAGACARNADSFPVRHLLVSPFPERRRRDS